MKQLLILPLFLSIYFAGCSPASDGSSVVLVPIIQENSLEIDLGPELYKNALYTIDATVSETKGTQTYLWEKVSGPGAIIFGTDDAEDTSIIADTQGEYVIKLTVETEKGQIKSKELTYTYDTTLPSVNAGSDALLKNKAFTQTATVTDSSPVVYLWSKISGPGDLTFSPENSKTPKVSASKSGSYVVKLKVIDAASNEAEDSFNLTWDSTAPVVTFTKTTFTTNVALAMNPTVTDDNAITYLWEKVSGTGTITFSQSTIKNPTISASANGEYKLKFTATDSFQNKTETTITFIWDTTAPVVDLGVDLTKNAQFTLSPTVTEISSATYLWEKVSGPGTITFGSSTAKNSTIKASADGTYVIKLTVKDALNNSGNDTMTLKWDTTKPVIEAGADIKTNASFSRTATATDTNTMTYKWSKVSGPSTITFSSDTALTTTIAASTTGSYVIKLVVTDAASNSSEDSFTLVWDTTAPAVTDLTDVKTKTMITKSVTATDANTPITYQWSKQSGTGTLTFSAATSNSTNITASADSTYVVKLVATDSASNATTKTFNMIWDSTAPSFDLGTQIYTKIAYSITPTVTDLTTVTYAWSKVSGPGTVSFSDATAKDTFVYVSAEGNYVLKLTATDELSNTSNDTVTFTWDQSAPTVNAGANFSTSADKQITDSTATDTYSPIATYLWEKVSGPGNITFSDSATLDPTVSADAEGTYVLRLTVTDQAGNTASDTVTMLWDETNPVVNVGADLIKKALYTQLATVSDASSVTYQWTASGPGTITFATATALSSGVSADTDGDYTLTLTVTDAAGNSASDDLTLTWDTAAPTVDAGADNSGAKTTFTQDADVTDTTALSHQWLKQSGPGTITFGCATCIDTAIDASVDGTYVLKLTSTDAAGNSASDTFTLVWDATNPIVSVGVDVATKVSISKTATASDATAMTYQWSKQSGPGSITFSADTALTSDIEADSDGVYVIRFTATDASSNSAYDEFTLTVDTTAPAITAINNQTKNGIYTQASSVTDALSTISYQWTKVLGPGTITFGNATGATTTISASSDGTYTIRITATDALGNSSYEQFDLIWDTSAPIVSVGADVTTNAQISKTATITETNTQSIAWSKISGPGTITFSSATTAATDISANADGVYVIRCLVTDSTGFTGYDEFTLTWDEASPTLNAGSDLITKIAAAPNASSSDLTSLSYLWEQTAGPGTISFSSTSILLPSISADTDGVYTLKLTATDSAGNSSNDTISFTWDTSAPSVNVGADLASSSPPNVSPTVTDALTSITYLWSKQSGPGTITFTAPTSKDTSISASADGVYVIRLTATDAAGNSANDELTLTWDATAPSVNVGADIITKVLISKTASITETNIASTLWEKVSGPGAITFSDSTLATTDISADTDGTYVIRCKVTDTSGQIGSDTFVLAWDTTAPTVNAGIDQIKGVIFSQAASATDTNALTYSWSKSLGAGTITFVNNNSLQPLITSDTDGVFTLQLTVTDAAGNSTSDTMQLTWDTNSPSVDAGIDHEVKASFTQNATISDNNLNTILWEKVSGPGVVTFGSATSEDTTVSASADGTYVIRVTATDATGASTSDTATFVWDTTAPSVNVGADIITKIALQRTATITETNSYTMSWAKQTGTGTISFAASNTINNPTISSDTEGSFTIRLTATDTAGNVGSDDLTFIWDTTVPTVEVGANITANALISKNATSSDSLTAITYLWSKDSGPGTLTFGSGSSEDTTITASADGVYVVSLQTTDQANNTSSDTFTLTWDTTAPVVDITPASDTTSDGSYDFSGKASVTDLTTVSYAWTQLSGPAAASISNTNILAPSLTLTTEGVYQFKLTATDTLGQSNFDTVTITYDDGVPFAPMMMEFAAQPSDSETGAIELTLKSNAEFTEIRKSSDDDLDCQSGELVDSFKGNIKTRIIDRDNPAGHYFNYIGCSYNIIGEEQRKQKRIKAPFIHLLDPDCEVFKTSINKQKLTYPLSVIIENKRFRVASYNELLSLASDNSCISTLKLPLNLNFEENSIILPDAPVDSLYKEITIYKDHKKYRSFKAPFEPQEQLELDSGLFLAQDITIKIFDFDNKVIYQKYFNKNDKLKEHE